MDDARREELEENFASEISKLNSRTRRQLLNLMGDPPQIENLTDDVWQTIIRDFNNVITPTLENVFIETAIALSESLNFSGVDFDLINQGAVDWARRHSGQTTSTMFAQRRQRLDEWVAQYYETTIDRDTLFGRVDRLFGPGKAEEIAITEITRAAVQGQRVVIDELGNQGVMMQKVWVTSRDSKVCPICGPLDGVSADGIGFDAIFRKNGRHYDNPPAHPRCRCGVRYDYMNEMRR